MTPNAKRLQVASLVVRVVAVNVINVQLLQLAPHD
jgi:hypothetical protein